MTHLSYHITSHDPSIISHDISHDMSLFCSLEQLSLKCCCLDDAFCASISSALAANRTIIALDLSSNQITDTGVEQLANALRLNRTLLSLCLAGNRIGDKGVKAICHVSMGLTPHTRYTCIQWLYCCWNITDIEEVSSDEGRGDSEEIPTIIHSTR